MSKQLYGVIGLCMLTAAIFVGLYGIFFYSAIAAGIYLAGCIVLLVSFVFAFCTKCPVRRQCVHVLMGLMTRLIPDRPAEPYTRCELTGVIVFFGFVAIFPQYWLIRNPLLMLAFWVLFIGEWALAHYTCCKGCGNRFCMLRYETGD